MNETSPNSGACPLASYQPAADERPAPWWPPAAGRSHGRLVAFTVMSLMAHASLYAAFSRQPDPLASIGEVLIEVDLVFGHEKAAGTSSTQERRKTRQQETETSDFDTREKQTIETSKTIANSELHDEVLDRNAALDNIPRLPDISNAPPAASSRQADSAAEPSSEPSSQTLLAARTSDGDSSKPTRLVERAPDLTPKERPHAKPTPQPREKRAERKEAARTKNAQAPARVASLNAASGAGLGRSDDEVNYRGIVAAHLARHKQFPADAQSRGEAGSATVAFALDGGGRVASVRLVRSSGSGTLDAEAQTMVRRASPFPPPPGGRTISFTVPLSFHLR